MTIYEVIEQNKGRIRFIGAQNGKLKQVEHLIRNTSPNPDQLCVLDGLWAHQMALKSKLEIRSFIFCPECIHSPEAVEMTERFLGLTDDIYAVSSKVLEKISEREEPGGLISLAVFPRYQTDGLRLSDSSVVVVLDGLEKPGNIGAILRTWDGVAVDAVFICNRRARLTHPKLIKGSMGAAFRIPVIESDSAECCRDWLVEQGFSIYLADTRADQTYREPDYRGRTALVMGSERYGITKPWYDGNAALLSIPMKGACDSLNVGVAASVILYEIGSRKQKL
jgi:TrmH family RNA methyltransferase